MGVIGVLPSGATAPGLARAVTNAGADPWSWLTASMAPCDPSDGSGSDRSCLDDGGVTRVSGARRVPGPTTYHRTPVSRMESSPSQQLRDITRFHRCNKNIKFNPRIECVFTVNHR